MPLRQTIGNAPETLTDILIAADDRYRDAEELLAQQHFDGCIYLLGYSVEMWLKAICMRLRGATPTDLVKPALAPLKKAILTLLPSLQFVDYHDLLFFVEGIDVLRRHNGMQPHPDQVELRNRIASLFDTWIVDMRYRRCGLSEQEAWAALDNAWWIKSNWSQFA